LNGLVEEETLCDSGSAPPLLCLLLPKYATDVQFNNENFMPLQLRWPPGDPRETTYTLKAILMCNHRHFITKISITQWDKLTTRLRSDWCRYDGLKEKLTPETLLKATQGPSLKTPRNYVVSALIYARV
jgi:hypothetical protein